MTSVDIMDAFFQDRQRPFRAEKSASNEFFVVKLSGNNLFVSRERLEELHAAIGAALQANQPAPETFGEVLPITPPPCDAPQGNSHVNPVFSGILNAIGGAR